jgi:hypothetical protein
MISGLHAAPVSAIEHRSSTEQSTRDIQTILLAANLEVTALLRVRRQGLEPRTRGLRGQSSPLRSTTTCDPTSSQGPRIELHGHCATAVAGHGHGHPVHYGRREDGLYVRANSGGTAPRRAPCASAPFARRRRPAQLQLALDPSRSLGQRDSLIGFGRAARAQPRSATAPVTSCSRRCERPCGDRVWCPTQPCCDRRELLQHLCQLVREPGHAPLSILWTIASALPGSGSSHLT